MRTVLESDLVAEQVFATPTARVKILLRVGNDLCTEQSGLAGIAVCNLEDFAALLNKDGCNHVSGPEPASWKEKPEQYKFLLFRVEWEDGPTIYFPNCAHCRASIGLGEHYKHEGHTYRLIGFTADELDADGRPRTMFTDAITAGSAWQMIKLEHSVWMLDEEPGE